MGRASSPGRGSTPTPSRASVRTRPTTRQAGLRLTVELRAMAPSSSPMQVCLQIVQLLCDAVLQLLRLPDGCLSRDSARCATQLQLHGSQARAYSGRQSKHLCSPCLLDAAAMQPCTPSLPLAVTDTRAACRAARACRPVQPPAPPAPAAAAAAGRPLRGLHRLCWLRWRGPSGSLPLSPHVLQSSACLCWQCCSMWQAVWLLAGSSC